MDKSEADLVLRNANAITLDRSSPHARTIYTADGRILKTSLKDIDRQVIGPHTQVIDCAGKTVIPAFHDAHCHIVGFAESMVNVDISPALVDSIEAIISSIKKAASMTPSGQWIRCAGYNEFYLKEKRHPLKYDLDRATLEHPVKLTHRSGHAHVLNSLALAQAGIRNDSEEPDGGMIERDLQTGEPNGLLFGMSSYLSQKIPPLDKNELDRAIENCSNLLLSRGVTSVQDASPGNDIRRWEEFSNWKKHGIFKPRTILMFNASETGQMHELQQTAGQLETGAVKLVLDEVRGDLNPAQAEINRTILAIHNSGLQAAIHAVEENTVNAAIRAIDNAVKSNPRIKHRHRIEHCSVCTPAAAGELASLGAVIVTNPSFIYYSGERYLSDVPSGQLKHLYALKTMISSALHVAAGSDAPIGGIDPFKGIFAAVTRKAESGQYVLPGESINVMTAIKLYTLGAAFSCFHEKHAGSISKGKYADLLILNADPLRIETDALKDVKVEMTVLNGEIVYQSCT